MLLAADSNLDKLLHEELGDLGKQVHDVNVFVVVGISEDCSEYCVTTFVDGAFHSEETKLLAVA